jgi:hypothetical protein
MKKILFAALAAVIFSLWAAIFSTPITSDETKPHDAVELKDASGKPIRLNGADPQPYSPRATCGGCHKYDRIAQGYHFQMGADKISDDFGSKLGKPWILSDGMTGRQFHMSYEWIAKKKNSRELEIALTPYRFAQGCGKCHAGGGLMERDRGGERYDVRQSARPELASTLDGDYHKAAWDKSGVLEIDCLMCHQPGYNAEGRASQLAQGNLKWAATVGAGLGVVNGAVSRGEIPKLSYNDTAFQKGKVRINITKPTDRHCLFCHAEAEVKKRGHVWDGRNDDVHTTANLKCVTCHPAKLDHQIAKGCSNEVTVRDDLDSDTVSCASCHSEGRLGASKPAHKSLPPTHLQKIACVTCHMRATNVTAVLAVDTTTGKTVGVPTSERAKTFGESFKWTPSYFRLKDGKIYAGNALLPVWWGNRVGGVIHPLLLSETKLAYEKAKDHIYDDNGDGKVEANTESEIRAMLAAIGDVLQGGRFDQISPVYVKGHKVYQQKEGRLTVASHPQASPLLWTFSHNVSPTRQAWGAGGCADCHSPDSTFFNSPVVTDPYGPDGQPIKVPLWQSLGLKRNLLKKVEEGGVQR